MVYDYIFFLIAEMGTIVQLGLSFSFGQMDPVLIPFLTHALQYRSESSLILTSVLVLIVLVFVIIKYREKLSTFDIFNLIGFTLGFIYIAYSYTGSLRMCSAYLLHA